jgi:hypothetical protein
LDTWTSQFAQLRVVGSPRPAFTWARSAPFALAKRRTISRCGFSSSFSSW